MKRRYLFIAAAMFSMLTMQCQDPLKDIEINVSTNIIHYSSMLQIEDGNGNAVNNLNVELTGRDAGSIYNLAGLKEFHIEGGLLGLGVHPQADPTTDKSVEFTLILSGNDIITQLVPLTITEGQMHSVQTINVLKKSDAPLGVSVQSPTVILENNTISGSKTVSTTNENETSNITNVTMTDGTKFQDESGKDVTGGELKTVLVNLDPSKESALAVFPGGSLTANNVIAEGQTQVSAGSFIPASIANIEFTVGSTSIKKFNKPIQIAMQLDPEFVNVNTGNVLGTGEQIGVYSYETTTGQWKFEKNVAVEKVNGKLVANFETTHLTWYMVGNYVSACTSPVVLNLNASWMQTGVTYPLKVDAMLAGKVIGSVQVSASTTNTSVKIANLPLSSTGVSIHISTLDGQVLTAAGGVTLPQNGCAAAHSIAISQPANTAPKVTLQLYVRCPGNGDVINVLPTFYLYYRETKSSSDASGFKLLGVVTNGFLSSTLLKAGTAEYDFKAVWGDKIKYANTKTLQVDNSATVGTQPGDIIGEKAGAVNLQMLTEACK